MSIFVVTYAVQDEKRRATFYHTMEDIYGSPETEAPTVLALDSSVFALKAAQTASTITETLREPLTPALGDWLSTHRMASDDTDCLGSADPAEWFDMLGFREQLVEKVVDKVAAGPSDDRDRKQLLASVRQTANEYLWSG